MKKFVLLTVLSVLTSASAFAGDRMIDLSSGCKLYILQGKAWKETDGAQFNGLALPGEQIVKDEPFTVFKAGSDTYGLNQRCLKDAPPPSAEISTPARRRSGTPPPERGDTHSRWAVIFGIGYNLSPKGNIDYTFAGKTSTSTKKYNSSLAFLGEANYRFNAAFRLAGELGLSQLSESSTSGNETSFFDIRPEFVFRVGRKYEAYIGPMIGVFFFSQNDETDPVAAGPDAGSTIVIKQQNATALLLGLSAGIDYALGNQFDIGFFVRYFKPSAIKVSGTENFPFPGEQFAASLSTSYLTPGLRFAIHF